MATLKVYRTPAGFHDAYVAATSQKAALAAWGSDADLFARGIAEVVIDPALTKEPLAKPGEVIKRARTAADATPEPPPKKRAPTVKATVSKSGARPAKKSPPPKPKPRPSRTALDTAEAALANVESQQAEARKALQREEAALAKRRDALRKEQEREHERLAAARDTARARYDAALARWRG